MSTRHQVRQVGAPRWVVPTWDTFRTPFFYRLLVLQDKKNIYILPEPVNHRIAEKSSVLFFPAVFCQIPSIMASSSSSKDKFFKNVINPYLREVVQHPQTIQMHEGVLYIRGEQGPMGTGTVEGRLEAMEQGVFRCKGIVERG